jgi:hypothetical protein
MYIVVVQLFTLQIASAQNRFTHRGYLGWMVDFSRKPIVDHWPSIRLDSSVYADYIETLDFLKRTGMNEITPWGLFTDENWQPDISETISAKRKTLINKVIKAAHDRNIKVMCGLGVYSWGFGKILQLHPELACPVNAPVMDLARSDAWEWQKKVLDYLIDNFDFDGISMQSGDKGWCHSGMFANISEMKYHSILIQKAVHYIRIKKPDYIIGICGWGMNMSNTHDFSAIVEMTRNVDYMIDVGETVAFSGNEYRKTLIKAISPCAYGSTATPNIEPIQALKRDGYFIPTTFATAKHLKEIFDEGGLACEAYARSRGNPGDLVTAEVMARILSNPESDINKAQKDVLSEIYKPANQSALNTLSEIFAQAEIGFFKYSKVITPADQYGNIILLMPRTQIRSSLEYFKGMDERSKKDYIDLLKSLLEKLSRNRESFRQTGEVDLLRLCISNTIRNLI